MLDRRLNRTVLLGTLALLGATACNMSSPQEVTEGTTEGTSDGTSQGTSESPTEGGGEVHEPPGEEAGSDKPRNLAPDATAEELATMAADERQFALELFKALPAGDDNRAISPLSLRVAFGMLYEGARTVTEQEVHDVLHFTLDRPRLHNAFNAIDLQLEARNLAKSEDAEGDDSVRLSLVNQMFGRLDIEWSAPYLDALAVHYGSDVHELDFAGDPEAARSDINGWVAGETFDKITELLPAGSIFPEVTAVLVNALYLKAPWDQPFEYVEEGVFTGRDGATIQAPMMHGMFETSYYYKGTGVEAAEVRLRGGQLSMVFIVPDAGTFDAYVAGLDGAGLGEVLAGLEQVSLEVVVPRFKFANAFALKDPLVALGMEKSFELGAADLSGMSTSGQMAIANVYHNTVVAIDEKGVEAAAATAVVVYDSGGGIFPETTFTADRPFLFAIRDRGTDSLLWFGRVLAPS